MELRAFRLRKGPKPKPKGQKDPNSENGGLLYEEPNDGLGFRPRPLRFIQVMDSL